MHPGCWYLHGYPLSSTRCIKSSPIPALLLLSSCSNITLHRTLGRLDCYRESRVRCSSLPIARLLRTGEDPNLNDPSVKATDSQSFSSVFSLQQMSRTVLPHIWLCSGPLVAQRISNDYALLVNTDQYYACQRKARIFSSYSKNSLYDETPMGAMSWDYGRRPSRRKSRCRCFSVLRNQMITPLRIMTAIELADVQR